MGYKCIATGDAMLPRHYEDFAPGQVMHSEPMHVDKDEMIAFARAYDPQPQHVDEIAAKDSQFGDLVASGWFTGGISMRMKIDHMMRDVVGGVAGLGLEQVRWPRPVKAGDTLRVQLTVTDTRPSKSKPTKGIVKYKVETFNQHDELVMEILTSVIVPRRPS